MGWCMTASTFGNRQALRKAPGDEVMNERGELPEDGDRR